MSNLITQPTSTSSASTSFATLAAQNFSYFNQTKTSATEDSPENNPESSLKSGNQYGYTGLAATLAALALLGLCLVYTNQ